MQNPDQSTSTTQETEHFIFQHLETMPMIGEKFGTLLSRLLGGNRVIDLLLHMPSNYIQRNQIPKIKDAQHDQIVTLKVKVEQHFPNKRKGSPYQIIVSDDSGFLNLSYFHLKEQILQNLYPIGATKLISGKIENYQHKKQMIHPDYCVNIDQRNQIPAIESIYPLSQGITQKYIQRLIKNALAKLPVDYLGHWDKSLSRIHLCETKEDLNHIQDARRMLAYDELYSNQLTLQASRQKLKTHKTEIIQPKGILYEEFFPTLPFTLTPDQVASLQDIERDFASGIPMRRLLQGDVGSGKTIIAFLSMLPIIQAGFQTAIMAPTEILARQHFGHFEQWANQLGLKAAILTGQEKGKKRQKLLEALEAGEINILIGTHAIFEDPVIFKNLGYAIIDEQHRYGVEQRARLLQKGISPHLLLMTATPIPRTLQMAFYGDLDISSIKTKPEGRKHIDTKAIPIDRMNDIIDALHRRLEKKEQIYWICPLINESEALDLAAAEERFKDLHKIFGDKVGIIHGQKDSQSKEDVLQQFQEGSISILVSTTVVEVGINVPRATTIIIEHAERFGLSQLHQLRGRVGRSDLQSYCLLLYAERLSPIARRRLEIMRETNDGFEISEQDLKLRGSGDVLGRAQSGHKEFKLARFPEDYDLLARANQDVKNFFLTSTHSTENKNRLRILLEIFQLSGSSIRMQSG
jgi:ATP-dependent DNA helicase RecG